MTCNAVTEKTHLSKDTVQGYLSEALRLIKYSAYFLQYSVFLLQMGIFEKELLYQYKIWQTYVTLGWSLAVIYIILTTWYLVMGKIFMNVLIFPPQTLRFLLAAKWESWRGIHELLNDTSTTWGKEFFWQLKWYCFKSVDIRSWLEQATTGLCLNTHLKWMLLMRIIGFGWAGQHPKLFLSSNHKSIWIMKHWCKFVCWLFNKWVSGSFK